MIAITDDQLKTTDALKSAALRHGTTPAQFAHAVETVGDDPKRVLAYLARRGWFERTDMSTK